MPERVDSIRKHYATLNRVQVGRMGFYV